MMPIRIGTSTNTIHAPSANFEIATSIATMPVVAAPTPLIAARQRQPGSSSRSFHQWRTMPLWLRVNATKTPTAYSGMRFVTLPPNAVGKDFRPYPYIGLTDSRTGVEASLWGVLGLKLGWVEGVEFNFLGLVTGFDIRHPAIKLPGFGRLGIDDGTALAAASPAS